MLIIVNSDEEEASAYRALEVINTLRVLPASRPDTTDTRWVKTRWPNEVYL